MLDGSQHVLLGCCNEAFAFFERIGVHNHISLQKRMTLVDSSGRRSVIQSSTLPAPLHLLPSLARMPLLTFGEKAQLCAAMARVALRPHSKEQSAAQYLAERGCAGRVISRLLEPVLVSALNETVPQISAKYARMVLLKTLLGGRRGYRLGVPDVTLFELLAEPAERFLRTRQCDVRTSARVRRVNLHEGQVTSLQMQSGEILMADFYVLAVPPWSLEKMGLPTWGGDQLIWRPIVAAHLFFEEDFALPDKQLCLVEEPFQWLFCRPFMDGRTGTYVQAVASAAESLANCSRGDIIDLARRAAGLAWPQVKEASLHRCIIYRSARATFSTSANADEFRPPATAPGGNAFLAGDWTATSWPATIEGAVRSGLAAAQAVADKAARH